MELYYLTTAALSAGADAFFAGIALGGKERNKGSGLAAAYAVILLECLTAHLFGKWFAFLSDRLSSMLGGAILFSIGLYGLVKKRKPADFMRNRRDFTFFSTPLTGFAVGIDGAVATISLTVMGIGVEAALIMAVSHCLFIEAGLGFSAKSLKRDARETRIPSAILLILGLYKILQ